MQGNFPHHLPLDIVATGPLKVTDLPPRAVTRPTSLSALATVDAAELLGRRARHLGVTLVSAGPAAGVR